MVSNTYLSIESLYFERHSHITAAVCVLARYVSRSYNRIPHTLHAKNVWNVYMCI